MHSLNEQPFKFSSEYADTETNLVYYNYRYYNPELGRWTKRDPINECGGVNIYGFINNKVINAFDSLGFNSVSVSAVVNPAAVLEIVKAYGIREAARLTGMKVAVLLALTYAERAANLIKQKKLHCRAKEFIKRQKAVDKAKGDLDAVGGRCTDADSCATIAKKAAAFAALHFARYMREIKCFKGGDAGYKKAMKSAVGGFKKCMRIACSKRCK